MGVTSKKFMIKKSIIFLLLFSTILFMSCKKAALKTDIIDISILREDSANSEIIELGIKDEIALTNKNVLFTTFIADSSYTSFIEEASKINAGSSKTVIAIGKNALDAAYTIMPGKNIIFSVIKDEYYFSPSENMDTLYLNARGVYYLPNITEIIEGVVNITKAKSLGYIYGKDKYSLYMKDVISNICLKNNIKYIEYNLEVITNFESAFKYSKKPNILFITKDKDVMENLYNIIQVAYDNFVPIVSTDIFSSKNSKILLAVDINYYRLGRITAHILNEFLDNKKMENINSIYLDGRDSFNVLINTDVAKHFKIKFPEELITNVYFTQ